MQTRLLSDKEIVSCPSCNKTRAADPGIYICGDCGAEFVAEE